MYNDVIKILPGQQNLILLISLLSEEKQFTPQLVLKSLKSKIKEKW